MEANQLYPQALFGCFNDISTCMYGTCCTLCLNADNFARVRSENCEIQHLVCCVHPFWVRQEFKRKARFQYDFCSDGVVMELCYPCAICQEANAIRTYFNRH